MLFCDVMHCHLVKKEKRKYFLHEGALGDVDITDVWTSCGFILVLQMWKHFGFIQSLPRPRTYVFIFTFLQWAMQCCPLMELM